MTGILGYRSRFEHFKVQKNVSGGHLPLLKQIIVFVANLGTFSDPQIWEMMYTVVSSREYKGLHMYF
jgi:hypothetical protein